MLKLILGNLTKLNAVQNHCVTLENKTSKKQAKKKKKWWWEGRGIGEKPQNPSSVLVDLYWVRFCNLDLKSDVLPTAFSLVSLFQLNLCCEISVSLKGRLTASPACVLSLWASLGLGLSKPLPLYQIVYLVLCIQSFALDFLS